MPSKSLFIHLFVAVLGQVASSPLRPREVIHVTPSVEDIVPKVVQHGPLDDAGLERLRESLAKPNPVMARRQTQELDPGQFTVQNKDGYVSVAIDLLKIYSSNPATECKNHVVDGPVQVLQAMMGTSSMRGFSAMAIGGKETVVKSTLEGPVDAGVFTLEPNDPVKDFYVFLAPGTFHGFNFTTVGGKTYSALSFLQSDVYETKIEGRKVDVGSGIIGRIRATSCSDRFVATIAFDFIDDIQSISISNITYSGFTDSFLPTGPGQTVTVGSQILDNRNSSIEQMITLQTTDSVTRTRMLNVADMWNVGGKMSIEGQVGLPLITESKVTAEYNWQIQRTTTEEQTESTVVTKSTMINLRCPGRKYCIGSSFYTIFNMDIDVEATFRAKTKSGNDVFWVQKGKYQGADSTALQLRVDEADSPPSKPQAAS
ncbi:hypothetical protein CCHL11_07686 [Colletotrichum chlorophyti]|uniref:Uncharacterized protein n=1 Tax=Colletotrichum chlorophyti TaxID=708187 RepID=A0A1Q8RCL1_9PEZI|nr:hypothetical protein CCHL11_07686 [Colletotrichum chlorophyti]